jgi:hypothetical protein
MYCGKRQGKETKGWTYPFVGLTIAELSLEAQCRDNIYMEYLVHVYSIYTILGGKVLIGRTVWSSVDVLPLPNVGKDSLLQTAR